MKKFYLLLLFSGFLTAFSQDFTYTNASLILSGPADANLSAHATIVNSGSQDYDVLCAITSSTMTPTHQKYFCFGDFCYDTNTTVSPLATNIRVGESAILTAYCIPNGAVGTSTVYYAFYDANGLSDTLNLSATYTFTPVGINEISTHKYSLSMPGPNPANNLTSISYNFASAKDARLVIQNLLGVQITEIKLKENQSTLIIPVSDMVNGIYLYTLMLDGKPAASKKLVIAHK